MNSSKQLKEEIQLTQETYALPVYSVDHIALDHGESLEIIIPSTLFLETLLCQPRGTVQIL